MDEIAITAVNNNDESEITDTGYWKEGTKDIPGIRFSIKKLPDLKDLANVYGTLTVRMTSRGCASREFEVKDVIDNGLYWTLTAQRVQDSGLEIFFPNKDFNIKAGDTFVLLNIPLPKFYVDVAAEKLYEAAVKYLLENDHTQYTYTPQIDPIFIENNKALKADLLPGNLLQFDDTDLEISGSIVIDTITIDEGKSALPSYDIVLRDDKEVSTIDRMQSQIDSIMGGQGGGYNLDQLKKIIESWGELHFLRKDQDDTAHGKITFEKGLVSGDTIDSMVAGKGTLITDNGRIQTDRIEVRQSMTVMDLVINQIQGMASDFEFTDVAKVSSVEKIDDTTCKLYLEKKTDFDVMLFRENDLIRQVVNTIPKGGAENFTSWMRVLMVDNNAFALTVSIYPDSEVPGGKNYLPQPEYNIGRRGNVIQGLDNVRANMWYLSSLEGRIAFLKQVFKPVIDKYNYGIILGDIPDGVVPEKFTKEEREMAIYAKNLFVDKAGFHQIDYNGNVVPNQVYRGDWSLAVAKSDSPYRNIKREYEATGGNKAYVLLEQHTVTHIGCLWGCLIDETLDEPAWNSLGWVMLQGDPNYYIDFTSSAGETVLINSPDTVITAFVRHGNIDITDGVMASAGTVVEWFRDTGLTAEDNAWLPTYADGGGKNALSVSYHDMGSGWGITYRKVTFTCRITIPVGDKAETVENTFGINM